MTAQNDNRKNFIKISKLTQLSFSFPLGGLWGRRWGELTEGVRQLIVRQMFYNRNSAAHLRFDENLRATQFVVNVIYGKGNYKT